MSQQITAIIVAYEAVETKDFETTIVEAIDSTLSTLGKPVKNAIYMALENKYGITKKEIPNKIEAFTETLESIFGQAAKIVEIRIIQRLNQKFKGFTYKPKIEELMFTHYLKELHHFMNK